MKVQWYLLCNTIIRMSVAMAIGISCRVWNQQVTWKLYPVAVTYVAHNKTWNIQNRQFLIQHDWWDCDKMMIKH